MSPTDENHQKADWSYYYALYHMLAHWAAFLSIFVLLVTLGVLLNTVTNPVQPQRVAHQVGAVFGFFVLFGVEVRLLWCIFFKESVYLLPPISAHAPELVEVVYKKGRVSFGLLVFATVCFTAWDIALVFGW